MRRQKKTKFTRHRSHAATTDASSVPLCVWNVDLQDIQVDRATVVSQRPARSRNTS